MEQYKCRKCGSEVILKERVSELQLTCPRISCSTSGVLGYEGKIVDAMNVQNLIEAGADVTINFHSHVTGSREAAAEIMEKYGIEYVEKDSTADPNLKWLENANRTSNPVITAFFIEKEVITNE